MTSITIVVDPLMIPLLIWVLGVLFSLQKRLARLEEKVNNLYNLHILRNRESDRKWV